MLNDFTGADKVYIACGYTDLRKGIDGLGQNKGAVLGTGWLYPPIQKAGAGSVPVAEE